jgi:ATP-dependent RNA helicase DDX19/DBP5
MSNKVDWAQCAEDQQKMLASELKTLKVSNEAANNDHENAPSSEGDSEDSPENAISSAEVSLLQKVIRTGLITTKQDIEVQRKDPNSPLYSVKTFEALKLRPELLKGLYAMGFDAPSKIQETALPTLLADP